MTKEQQTARLTELFDLCKESKKVYDLFDRRDQTTQHLAVRVFISGYAFKREPDPILYFAMLRGGNVIEEIIQSINEVAETEKIKIDGLNCGVYKGFDF